MLAFVLSVALLNSQARADSSDPWEWSATFNLDAVTYVWQAQKTGCPLSSQAYADATMKIAVIQIPNTTAAGLKAGETAAKAAFGSASSLNNGQSIIPGNGHTLGFDKSVSTSEFPLPVSNTGSYGIFAEHGVSEFEFDKHYLITQTGEDVEPVTIGGGHDGHHHHSHVTSCVLPATKRPDCSCTAAGELNCENRWCPDAQFIRYNKKEIVFGFSFSARIEAAFDILIENNCNKSCNCFNPKCQDAFFRVDQHHAGCNADQLPVRVEEGFHWFEGSCIRCYETPFQNPVLSSCGNARCVKEEIASNLTVVQECKRHNQCIPSNATCAEAWNAVIVEHDSCCESDLPENFGTLFHSFEESCVGGCNLQVNTSYLMNCNDPKNTIYRRDNTGEDSGTKLSTGALAGIIVVVALVGITGVFAALYFFYLKPKNIEEAQKVPMPLPKKDTTEMKGAHL